MQTLSLTNHCCLHCTHANTSSLWSLLFALHTCKHTHSLSFRFVRLGTASMLSDGEQFINVDKLDFKKYVRRPALAKVGCSITCILLKLLFTVVVSSCMLLSYHCFCSHCLFSIVCFSGHACFSQCSLSSHPLFCRVCVCNYPEFPRIIRLFCG